MFLGPILDRPLLVSGPLCRVIGKVLHVAWEGGSGPASGLTVLALQAEARVQEGLECCSWVLVLGWRPSELVLGCRPGLQSRVVLSLGLVRPLVAGTSTRRWMAAHAVLTGGEFVVL